ncbi:hypothetical protein FH620_24440 [Corallococcus exiguus]|nr:hypothetical protein FH620_24440 [Corallococcus exiguus]
MGRLKSLITRTTIDIAQRAHNCQANSKHRIERGDTRLKVSNGRSWDHYCEKCAKEIISRDLQKLTALQQLTPSADALPVEDSPAGQCLCLGIRQEPS